MSYCITYLCIIHAVKPFDNSRITYTCMLSIMHHLNCVSMGRLDKVYIKVDMGERQKTLKFGLNGHGTEVESRAQGLRPWTQKNIRGQTQPFQGQTLSTARTRAQVFSKKNNIKVFNNFFHAISKKMSSKFFFG